MNKISVRRGDDRIALLVNLYRHNIQVPRALSGSDERDCCGVNLDVCLPVTGETVGKRLRCHGHFGIVARASHEVAA